ncbi:MAG: hypothetical protein KAT58_12740 [candidate division Zixibacteria bacterium]|nr:hypothetical protein [candidate division Zixibacteria bacterium]
MVLLHGILWLIAGTASILWLAFRIVWPFLMMVLAEAVIIWQIHNNGQVLAVIISALLFLGMLVLAMSMSCHWTFRHLKKEWKKTWQWDGA